MSPNRDEPDLDRDQRTRLWPNSPELSKEGYQGNPDPWRVTKWAEGYDVLGQPTNEARLKGTVVDGRNQ